MARRDFSAERRDPSAVGALGRLLVDRLEVVQAGGQQEGQRGPDEQVVDVAGQLLVEPRRLLRVEHRAAVRLEDPRRAGVDDDEAAVAEVAPVAPPVDLRVPVDPGGQVEDGLGEVDLVVPLRRRRRHTWA